MHMHRGYREAMSLAASDGEPSIPAEPQAPGNIRSRLLPEEAGTFDREYRRAMAEATEALDLTPVLKMLSRWEKIARFTQHDPEAHRRALRMAAALNAGEDVPMRPWQEVKRELGL